MLPSVWVCEPSIVTSGGPFGSDGTHDPTETVPITSVSFKSERDASLAWRDRDARLTFFS